MGCHCLDYFILYNSVSPASLEGLMISTTVFICLCLDIKEEAINSRAEVKSFDQTKLKHVETEEKNPLPDARSK